MTEELTEFNPFELMETQAEINEFLMEWYAAIALAGFSILSALLFHADFSNQAEMTNFMKNIAIAGGFLTLFVHGPGAFALDNRATKKDA